jgi:hypothetical protein
MPMLRWSAPIRSFGPLPLRPRNRHASPRGQVDKLVRIKAELMICSKMRGNDVFTTPSEEILGNAGPISVDTLIG